MSISPIKINAWSQGLYEVSATKKECLGALRETEDGRKFRYAKAGDTLIVGGATYSAAATSNHVNQIQSSGAANSAGDMTVAVYVGDTAVTANQYDDGYLVVYQAGSGTAGYYYPIASHTVSAAGNEIVYVTLKEPLAKATYTDDYFSLFANPWSGIGNVTAIAVSWSGQAMAAATSGQYLWVQTGGFGVAFGGDTSAVGTVVCPSDDTYALETAAGYTGPFVGHVYSTAFASGYFTPVLLKYD